jgi:hypothetical protein
MEKKLKYYLDNFRGFQDTYVELKHINFFVGENSSGKTSLISALTIMSYNRFWTEAAITDEIEFKAFSDLHSVNATRDYFTLGSINNEKTVHIYSFANDDGLAIAFREIIYTNDHGLCIIAKKLNNIFVYFGKFFIDGVGDQLLSELLDHADVVNEKNEWNFDSLYYISDALAPFYVMRNLLRSDKEKYFFADFLKKAGVDTFPVGNSTFLAPIRAKPQAIYSGGKKSFSSEGSHIPFTIKELLLDKNSYSEHIKKYWMIMAGKAACSTPLT